MQYIGSTWAEEEQMSVVDASTWEEMRERPGRRAPSVADSRLALRVCRVVTACRDCREAGATQHHHGRRTTGQHAGGGPLGPWTATTMISTWARDDEQPGVGKASGGCENLILFPETAVLRVVRAGSNH